MQLIDTRLDGPLLIQPKVFGDERGFFAETYRRSVFADLGIPEEMVQDNHSRSGQHIVRGMHFQIGAGAAKLVRCGRGRIVDVVVDVRRGSPTFGRWSAVELSSENRHQLWIPPGFAHGFCVLSDFADFHYKCTTLYAPETEHGVLWNDPDLGIPWPVREPLLSGKDARAPRLKDAPVLPVFGG